MNGLFDNRMVGWIGRCACEWKKNMFRLPGTVHKIMFDRQSEELDRSDERDLHQVRHFIIESVCRPKDLKWPLRIEAAKCTTFG